MLDLASRQASVRRLRKVADEQFVRVERAYRVLCDPVKRLVSWPCPGCRRRRRRRRRCGGCGGC